MQQHTGLHRSASDPRGHFLSNGLFRALLWETFCSGRDDLPLHCGRGATSHVCLVALAWNVASVTEEWNLSFYLLLTNLGDHLNALM